MIYNLLLVVQSDLPEVITKKQHSIKITSYLHKWHRLYHIYKTLHEITCWTLYSPTDPECYRASVRPVTPLCSKITSKYRTQTPSDGKLILLIHSFKVLQDLLKTIQNNHVDFNITAVAVKMLIICIHHHLSTRRTSRTTVTERFTDCNCMRCEWSDLCSKWTSLWSG